MTSVFQRPPLAASTWQALTPKPTTERSPHADLRAGSLTSRPPTAPFQEGTHGNPLAFVREFCKRRALSRLDSARSRPCGRGHQV
ncbi:hypothetical protein PoB_001689900 [Plakobranchus ocellatus]|uniref:Uncharacterized protein n=1 Tax=Plakobranchus ocellatus TaxID=259542 RepID=A0AAV3Z7M1_9GAST|nr:hypothetical protein PoB_001689900 [Plakobranchus ocellatus]